LRRSTIRTTTNENQVTGMTCGHCELSVREEVGELSEVTDIQVSAQTVRLVVTSENQIDDTTLLGAVEEAGYSAVRA
jgi:copper chaperone